MSVQIFEVIVVSFWNQDRRASAPETAFPEAVRGQGNTPAEARKAAQVMRFSGCAPGV